MNKQKKYLNLLYNDDGQENENVRNLSFPLCEFRLFSFIIKFSTITGIKKEEKICQSFLTHFIILCSIGKELTKWRYQFCFVIINFLFNVNYLPTNGSL